MGTDQNPAAGQPTDPHQTSASDALDRNVLDRTAEHLHERYGHVVDRATVDRVVQECYDELKRTSRIQAHVVASAGNFADNRLRAMAIAAGAIESTDPRVLFICNGNADQVEQLEGKDYRDWDIPTIVDLPLEEVRRIRNEIDTRVQELLRELEGSRV